MRNLAYRILFTIEKNGELTLEEVARLLPKKYNDHRDFYILASLITGGLVEDPYVVISDKPSSTPDPYSTKTQLLAGRLFAMSSADQGANFKGQTWMLFSSAEKFRDQKVSLTGKGSLYLTEARTRRNERVVTIASGIFIGIVVALVSAAFR